MSTQLHLFAGYGVELEYMIVDSRTLSVLPIADRILEAVAGEIVSEVEMGEISWSNELMLHVIELKTNGPAPSLKGLAGAFARDVGKIEDILAPLGGRLMPTAAHPWMDPLQEARIWPHEYSPIYNAYDTIFGCSGHGWANLQSAHLNLPFIGDGEFGRLHAAIRLILPIMPALTASTPVLEGRATGLMDSRMDVYCRNSLRVPSVAGRVVPEPAFTREEYDRLIFQPMYRDIAPFDPEGILKDEFLNSRGAIARFGRGSIEIRVLDIQECPGADLALAWLISEVLRHLCLETWSSSREQKRMPTDPLVALFHQVIKDDQRVRVTDRQYLELLGIQDRKTLSVGEIWSLLLSRLDRGQGFDPSWEDPLRTVLTEGTLSRRILRRLGQNFTRTTLGEVYGHLCDCLREDQVFHG